MQFIRDTKNRKTCIVSVCQKFSWIKLRTRNDGSG
jgi:hypothetical protein